MVSALALQLVEARRGVTPVLGAISLEVDPGETVAITGPSGIGKTTLLRILAGLHQGWRGKLDLPGRVAMVFQEPTLLPWRTAVDNITITTGCTSQEAIDVLHDVGLAEKALAYPGALSLGQQRRLGLARAFARRPQVLLLDEAFVSLDPALADEMMLLFEQLCKARPLATVMVTHVASEAERLATRILRLEGRPATLLS